LPSAYRGVSQRPFRRHGDVDRIIHIALESSPLEQKPAPVEPTRSAAGYRPLPPCRVRWTGVCRHSEKPGRKCSYRDFTIPAFGSEGATPNDVTARDCARPNWLKSPRSNSAPRRLHRVGSCTAGRQTMCRWSTWAKALPMILRRQAYFRKILLVHTTVLKPGTDLIAE